MKETKTITEAAEIIRQAADDWVESPTASGSICALTVRTARRQSKDPALNIAAWMMYNYGGLYSGETEDDWIQAAKDILRISK